MKDMIQQGPYWGFDELGNINRTSLSDHVAWPLWEQVLGIAYYLSISVTGILGNVFIIYAAERIKKQSTDRKTLLIIRYLATVDLFSSAILYPNFIYFTYTQRYNLMPFYCKILGILEIYFPTTSTFLVLMLVAVKVDMLRHPFHSLSSSTKWIHLGCIAISLSGLLIPSAPFYNLATYVYCPKRMTCTFDFYPDWNDERPKFIFVTWAVVFCCVAPLMVITGLSFYIIKKVRASRRVQAGKNVPDQKKTFGKSVRVVLLVVLAYAVTWASFFFVFTVAFFFRTELIIPRSLLFWPKASLMTNNAVNPIVYIYSNVNMQRFLIMKCIPTCIAKRTTTYQDIKKSEQEKIYKTTIMKPGAPRLARSLSFKPTSAPSSTPIKGSLKRAQSASSISSRASSTRRERTRSRSESLEFEESVNSVVLPARSGSRKLQEVEPTMGDTKGDTSVKMLATVLTRLTSSKKKDIQRSSQTFSLRYEEFMGSQLESCVCDEEKKQNDVSSSVDYDVIEEVNEDVKSPDKRESHSPD